MPQFKRIEFVDKPLFLPDPPRDAVVMENLQTLMGVENFRLGERAIERISNMKKLWMRYSYSYSGQEGFEHEDYYCVSNIQHLCNLESLRVSVSSYFERVEALNKLAFPHSLKKLVLRMIPKFEWEDMLEKIGSLPLLEKLELENKKGFRCWEWEIAEGQFPCLKYLRLVKCYGLRKMTTQDSITFPRLECLYLDRSEELEEIPCEIGEIATLQKISMRRCTASVVKRAKEIVEEQMELQEEVLSFNVVVKLYWKNEELLSLAGPNFQISSSI